jgi:hypothetical protein
VQAVAHYPLQLLRCLQLGGMHLAMQIRMCLVHCWVVLVLALQVAAASTSTTMLL